ncbi:hypothetical protein SSX86_006787 [Deinandra increscens subsp. villosa]|uniref:Wound-responsive family protein n=1 Tax=Deinandra increscens subsp. villosa TaxID=3103831 RepID=A0AAP0H906_9ASTR
MSGEAVRKAWVVAASIGTVEALKDQGVARWNGRLTELQRHAETKVGGSKYYCCSRAGGYGVRRREEERMEKVMEVSCFGPNTVRF